VISSEMLPNYRVMQVQRSHVHILNNRLKLPKRAIDVSVRCAPWASLALPG
jgi:hypothetical protein